MPNQSGSNFPLAGFAVNPKTNPPFVIQNRAPTTTDYALPGTRWQDDSASPATIWQTTGGGLWYTDSGTGFVNSVTGTANQISASPTTGAVVLSLIGPYTPATYTAHGVLIGEGTSSIVATAAGTAGQVLTSGGASADPTWTTSTFPSTVAAGSLLAATSANVVGAIADVATGQLLASGGVGVVPAYTGSPSVSGTVTAGTGLTATTGNLTVSSGDANVTGNVVASKSSAGANVTVQATNSDNTSGTSNAGVEVAAGGASGGDPYVSFQISGEGASTMTMGLDNSASDLFVISNSASIGTSNALTLSQAGALSATTTITAGTGIASTTGNITATAGALIAGGDPGGVASTNGLSNASSTTIGAGVGSVKMSTGNSADNTAWLKVYIGTSAYWIPAWTTNAP